MEHAETKIEDIIIPGRPEKLDNLLNEQRKPDAGRKQSTKKVI